MWDLTCWRFCCASGKVAGTYLNTSLRYSMIPFFIVRDFMHEKVPESRNKTSRACQRRVNYMMRNPTMVYQVRMSSTT